MIAQLSRWRQTYGLTQERVARLVRVSAETYRQWEAGRHCPQYRSQRRILRLIAKPPPRGSGVPVAPLRRRILEVLAASPQGQAHYLVLADRLHAPPRAVLHACYRMLRAGRVRWLAPGHYALPSRSA